ncbi:MAG: hypothetical protein US57_C0013G0032 [Candidatus Moranbacteria bacterium GW2011_GWC2_37_73]|nr:MAG: hypothetical protein UR95_C0003G0103 [Parcubacteria group bacterium GW2011_GWC1_36_108]KKQ00273.1 MAG: hypothetical protein US09_C0016G0010 [Candidatus Moranbacteria bacterium GW2011_GWD1_36_198]KKQ39452.1 MAG: hypothetical protein US57_C0013G0032 [Candidatus Moranbacteria bacterium GW2011_GWC2_37_73]HAR99633.1 hypothetical protein [Candidatus Moranbacteria bacterium]HBI50345.1 hypothetical protein [Candidatus Moranbacteria bacterium]
MLTFTRCSISAVAMASAIAAADLRVNSIGIEIQHEKGAPVHFVVRIYNDDYGIPSARIMDVAYGVWPSSQQASPNGVAAYGEIFAGVSARCRSPCLAAPTIYLWEPLFLA